MDIEKLHREYLLRCLSDSDLRKSLQQLSVLFTTQRDKIAQYGLDEKLVSAYAAFYLPTNMQKLQFILSQLSQFPIEVSRPFEVVDFGCGPGTYSFALFEYIKKPLGRFHFVDTAALMRAQAMRIQQGLYSQMNAFYHCTVPEKTQGHQRLVILGNVINEIGFDGFYRLLPRLAADAFIIIEPGTQEAFSHMTQVRSALVQRGYQIAYPCPNAGVCPATVFGPDEWCHQVLKASLEPAVGRIGQLARLDRTVMPFIGHVYTKGVCKPHRAVLFRLKKHSKYAFFWEVCMETQDGMQLQKLELPKKFFSKKEQKRLLQISAGTPIAFTAEKQLADGTIRVSNPVFG